MWTCVRTLSDYLRAVKTTAYIRDVLSIKLKHVSSLTS